jgi:hypothetical protein
MRDAYDSGDLVNLCKGTPETATDVHIAVIGHITQDGLRETLADGEKRNGLANRFTWLYAVRSRVDPTGGNFYPLLETRRVRDLIEEVKTNLRWARGFEDDSPQDTRVRRTPECEAEWAGFYNSSLPPGKLGEILQRRDANVLRLSMIHALSMRSTVIKPEHLHAAIAFHEYSERSCKLIFPDDVDPQAERLLKAMDEKPAGLSKTEIVNRVFGKNAKKEEIDELLKVLLAERRIVHVPGQKTGKAGRPSGGKYRRPINP